MVRSWLGHGSVMVRSLLGMVRSWLGHGWDMDGSGLGHGWVMDGSW